MESVPLADKFFSDLQWLHPQEHAEYYCLYKVFTDLGIFSIYAAQTISEFNKVREKENRKLLAGKLENEQDQIAEYLFDDIADKASKDKVLRSFESSYDQLVSNASTEEVISRRMAQLYFTGYWGKYDIAIKCFNMDGLPINTGGDPTWNLDYFNVIINEESTPTYSPYLRFSGNNAGRISYIGKLRFMR